MSGVANWIEPDWPAPPGVRAAFTLRGGGVSTKPYDSLNLAQHVGDESIHVLENRWRLKRALELPAEPLWLDQVHGSRLIHASEHARGVVQADACWTQRQSEVCVVMVADCLPVLMAASDGRMVAALHAGWRGLAAGILERSVQTLLRAGLAAHEVQAWLGPCIGQEHFEVGPEVRAAFVQTHPNAASGFERGGDDRWHADLQLLAALRLRHCGIRRIHADACCTYADARRWFSYRRDGQSGRMAALIWRQAR